jgi:hypothetical protein
MHRKEAMKAKCFECRNGEHDDEDDNIKMCNIVDPKTGKTIKRGNLCGAHQTMYLDDGYRLV